MPQVELSKLEPPVMVPLQYPGIEGILITYVGDPPLPCVSILSNNPDIASQLADRARELLMLLRK